MIIETPEYTEVFEKKALLNSFDYKIIKMAEIIIKAYKDEHPDVELPYDIDDLIEQRNTMRERINELEGE